MLPLFRRPLISDSNSREEDNCDDDDVDFDDDSDLVDDGGLDDDGDLDDDMISCLQYACVCAAQWQFAWGGVDARN